MRSGAGYKTKQRESILQRLKENPNRHITVDELTELMHEKGDTVGKTTVYRYLEKLCNDGLVRKYLLPNGDGACYQLCDECCAEHFHLKCTVCARLIHTQCSFLSELAEHIKKDHDFEINQTRTVLYGICRDCREKTESEVKQ